MKYVTTTKQRKPKKGDEVIVFRGRRDWASNGWGQVVHVTDDEVTISDSNGAEETVPINSAIYEVR